MEFIPQVPPYALNRLRETEEELHFLPLVFADKGGLNFDKLFSSQYLLLDH